MKNLNLKRLIMSILATQAAGALGSIFTVSSIPTWYATLHKPTWVPPNWIFGPVWTLLYTLMGIALYLVWEEGRGEDEKQSDIFKQTKKTALTVFGIQLALNTFWSILFFGLKSPDLALFEISLLWVAIAATIFYFFKISKTAALLLIPYLLWTSFAAFLNLSIVKLN